jgi:hypothetical protein
MPDGVWLGHEASVGETNDEQSTGHKTGVSTKITFPIYCRSMPLCSVKLYVDPGFTKQAVKVDNSTIEVDLDLRLGWRQVRMAEDVVVAPELKLAVTAAAYQR